MSYVSFADRAAPIGLFGSGNAAIDALLGPLEPSGLGVDFVADKAIRRWAADPQAQFVGPVGSLPGLTFSRASTAMRWSATGVYESVANNTLRIDHNPQTLQRLGALIEPARTNLAVYSCAIGTAPWGATAIGTVAAPVVTLNNASAPDATTTGTRIVMPAVPASAANGSRVGISISGLNAGTYTFSAWLKGSTGGESVYMSATTNAVNYVRRLCILTTGWQRFDVTVSNPSNGATYYFQIGTDLRDASQTATAAQTFYAWGAQLEAGAEATSLVITGATTATRASDTAQMQTSAFAFNSTAGTAFVECSRVSGGGVAALVLASPGGNRIGLSRDGATPIAYANISNVDGWRVNGAAVASGATGRSAHSWGGGSYSVSHGGALVTGTLAAVPSLSTLWIGRADSDGYTFNGHIRRLSVISRKIPNVELQALTS
ncbi:MAG: hypothetical protein B7Z30_15490 [Rhizobiales bacterium 12-68-15]|nr:MAG: hypothetical protein B7Z30_15490 [Rhizobiales bacterium 12-68-15]